MSRKMIEYEVENGNISTIDGFSVGDKITGAKLKENITPSSSTDGMSYTLATDGTGRLIIHAKGRYEYKSGSFSQTFKAPAGTYLLGKAILLSSKTSIPWGYFISIDSTYDMFYPLPNQRVEGEPVWRIEALPNSDGSMYVKAVCVKEGTLAAEKNYGRADLHYTYLYYGNY